MPKSFAKALLRPLSIILTLILAVSGLPLIAPNSAFADSAEAADSSETEVLQEPSYVNFYMGSSSETEVQINFHSDVSASSAAPMLLYREGNPVALQTAIESDEWKVVQFTVPRPASGFEDYYVTFGAQTSDMVRVYDSPESEFALTLTADRQVFTAEEGPPDLKWTIAKWLNFGQIVYIVQEETGEIIYRGNSSSVSGSYDGQSNDFIIGPPRGYRAYVADESPWPSSFSELTNIQASSAELIIQRAPWNVQISISSESYTGDDDLPTISWSTNQDLSFVQGIYKLFIVDVDTEEVVANIEADEMGSSSGEVGGFGSYNQQHRKFKAVLASGYDSSSNYSDLQDIQAESNIVSTVHEAYSISLSMDKATYQTGEMPVLTWTTNQRLPENFCVSIEDSSGLIHWLGRPADIEGRNGRVSTDRGLYSALDSSRSYFENEQWLAKIYELSPYESNCGAGFREDGTSEPFHYYNGIVELGTEYKSEILTDNSSLATSNIVGVEWPQQQLTLTADKYEFSHSDETPIFTVQLNQGLARRQGIVLVDEGTGKIVSYYNEDSVLPWPLPEEHPSLAGLPEGEYPSPDSLIYQYSGWPNRSYEYVGDFSRTYVAYLVNNYDRNIYYNDQIFNTDDIAAVSQPITIERKPWELSMEANCESCSQTDYKLTFSVKANQFLEPKTSFDRESESIYIVDETGRRAPDYFYSENPSETESQFHFWASDLDAGTLRAVMAAPGNYPIGEVIPKAKIVAKSKPVSISSAIAQAKKWAGGYNSSDTACEQTCLGDPVNAYTGEFFETEEDLAIDGPLPFGFSRSNGSSSNTKLGAFGYGWTHNFAMRVDDLDSDTSSTVSVVQENGSVAAFFRIASDEESSNVEEYLPAVGVNASFKEKDGEYLFTRRGENITYVFDASGRLARIQDLSSNTITMNYSGNKLQEVVSSSGQSIALTWSGDRISSLSDGQRTVSYNYSGSQLRSVQSSVISGIKSYSYDSQNRVTQITHPNSGTYSNTYDSEGRVTLQTDPLGGDTAFSYDSTEYDQTTTSTLPDGTIIRDTYDLQGRLILRELAQWTAERISYSYEYNLSGQKISEEGPSGIIARYGYNSAGDLTSVTDALNRTTRFTYTASGKPVETIDATGKISTNSYDAAERLISSKDPNGNVTQYTLNSNGAAASITQVGATSNQATQFGYNSKGLLTTVTNPAGGVQTTALDGLGYPLARTDALGRVTTLEYNTRKQLVKEISPAGASNGYSYDAAGRVTKETDELGRETVYEYDAMDNVVKMTTGYGSTVYSYDSLQRLISAVHPGGGEQKWKYDGLGRVIESTDINGAISTRKYYPNGLLNKSTDNRGKATTYTYDAVGNLTKTVGPGSVTTKYKYDALNRLISTTLADGFVSSSTYDSNGNKLTSTRGGIETTSYKYDHRDLLTKMTYPDAVEELRSYNADGLLANVTERGGAQVSYGYDLAGQTTSATRADGTIATYSYNLDSLLSDVSFDGGATVESSYTYSVAGQLMSEATASELTTYSYDAMGNMTRRGPPGQPGVTYGYSSIGNLTSTVYPSGVSLTQSYNADDTLSSVALNGTELVKYGYDLGQNVVGATYGNGVADKRTYDNYSRLASIGLKKGKIALFEKKISYTNTGLLATAATTINTVADSREYGYSAVRRLESVLKGLESSAYSHDVSSNVLSGPQGTQNYSSGGTLTSSTNGAETASYAYDLRGNRLSKTAGTENTAFAWTQDDKLASVTSTGANPFSVGYSYGANGLLSTRTENGNSSAYVWDTSRPVPTMLEDGAYSFIYGVGVAPFAQIEKSTGKLTYLHGDERESIVAATDSTGGLLWSRSYDEYGYQKNEVIHKPSSVNTAFGYAGQYQDETTGLYNLRARWYDPQTASFLSKDPALLLTGESHAYASGDPLSFTDPLGLASESSTQIAATIDGLVGMPLGSKIMNGISPGSVDNCSSLYTSIAGVASVASFLIPGAGAVKTAKLISVAEYNGIKLAGSYNELSRMTPGRRLIMEHNHMPTWNFIKKSTNEHGFTRGSAPTIAMDYADHRALDTTLKSRTYAQSQIDRGLSFNEATIEDWQEVLKLGVKYEPHLEAYLNEYGKRFGITAKDFR